MIDLSRAEQGAIPEDIELPGEQLAALFHRESGYVCDLDSEGLRERHRLDVASGAVLVFNDAAIPVSEPMLLWHPRLRSAWEGRKRT
jgi:hypothetical protein